MQHKHAKHYSNCAAECSKCMTEHAALEGKWTPPDLQKVE